MRAFHSESGASLIPWLVAVTVALLAGGVVFKLNSINRIQERELLALRAEVKELEALRAEAQELSKLRAQVDGAEALKKQAEELPRLRGEVSRLRAEQQQLIKAQGEVQRLQGALQQQQAQVEQLRALQAQPPGVTAVPTAAYSAADLQMARVSSLRAACLANLRQLDGAKATWALENRKTASDIPVDDDLIGPRLYIREKPVCPAGGAYSLLPVDTKPACNILGHTL